MMLPIRLPVHAALLLALVMASTTGVAADDGAGLPGVLIEALRLPANAGAAVVLAALGGSSAKLMGASAAGIDIRVGDGGNLALPWARLTEADLIACCRPFMAKTSSHQQAAYLGAAIRLGHGHDRDAQDLLASLRTSDPAAAQDLDAQLAATVGPAKEPAHTPPAAAPAAGAPAADDPGDAGPSGDAPRTERDRLAAALGTIVGKDGKLSKTAYLRTLSGSLRTIDQWLGPDWAYYHAQDRHPATAKGTAAKDGLDKDGFPTLYLAPSRTTKFGHNNAGLAYQIGGDALADGGDYSSTQGQVLYVPDKATDAGCDRVQILEQSNDILIEKPMPPWWGGWHPEPALLLPSWAAASGGRIGVPLNINRSCASWDNCGLIVFNSGLIGAAGTCTDGACHPCLMLPPGKVPTAVSITNKNEFALVTVWDTQLCKGQLAVIVLSGYQPDGKNLFLEWKDHHPGLPNGGAFGFLKLLGFIDLPIAAPSDVCAVGNRLSDWIRINGKNAQARECDLAQQAMRDSFYSGENKDIPCTAGFAVVISRAESKAVFVDLAPLFLYAREMYFTSPENYAKTTKVGQGPKDWPYAFEVEPRWRPRVVHLIDVPHPTAVNITYAGSPVHACIATLDGQLRLYTVGALAGGTQGGEIAQCGVVRVGRNPTCIAYAKSHWDSAPHADSLTSEVVVVSRGERDIEWVQFHGDSGEVYRTLRDSRLVDPVHAEVADNHGTCSYIISVTDFKGRKLVNYRYGPVIFHTNNKRTFGMGPDGKDEYECAGILDVPGFPYRICASNVN
jgi:hypothetical protein